MGSALAINVQQAYSNAVIECIGGSGHGGHLFLEWRSWWHSVKEQRVLNH